MGIYLYVRTSEFEVTHNAPELNASLDQAIDHELRGMQAYCDKLGWHQTTVIRDHASPWQADFPDRDASATLAIQLHKGDVLVVHALERIFSSCYDAVATLERLRDLEVALHVVTLGGDVTSSTLQLDVFSAARIFSGLERRRSVERIKNVKQEQRSKGRYLGGSRPFGYMIHSNGRLIENPMEQKVLKRIMQLRDQGKSLRAIAADVSTPVAPISFKTVQRILQRNV